jgi:pyruvate/2-oxoacid:ferredoxin oxidoreductase beta subunit
LRFREAEAYDGPSLILAYSQCIATGTDLRHGMKQAARAVASGHWPLLRFDPTMRSRDMNPFRLDSTRHEFRWRSIAIAKCGSRSSRKPIRAKQEGC